MEGEETSAKYKKGAGPSTFVVQPPHITPIIH